MSSAPGIVLAHGIGSRTDLPIPLSLALYGSGMAVVISFAALGLLWPKARLTGDRAGRPIPLGVQRVLDAPALRWALRLLALAIAAFVVVVALAGPRDAVSNLAPYTLYIVFWCGLVAVSLLLGPVWRAINPLRTLHRALSAAGGSDPDEGLRPLPESLGYWPAAASIAVFVWLELVPSWRARPVIVGVFLVAYTTAHLVAAQVYGARWFDRGEGFEVYSTLIGRLAPLGRRDDGRLVLRNPMNGLDGVRAAPGLVAVVAVLIGSTGFDGVTRTKLWRDNVASDGLITGTLGITGTIAVVAIAYLVATSYAGRLGDPDGDLEREPPMSARFAHSVIPIAVGYAVAHYFSLLIFDGQQALILASDPFQTGADLIGTSDRGIDYDLVSTSGIAYVQVGAIVLGHVVGVIAAHDRAVRLFDKRRATRSQYPLLAVMVAFTVGGVALLFGT